MKNKIKKGFTLVELIVVMAVIAVLVLLAMPKFISYTEKATITRKISEIKEVESAALRYYMDNDAWPKQSENYLTAEELADYEKLMSVTGYDFELDKDGKYYYINLGLLKNYVKISSDDGTYIIQNPVGDVYFTKGKDLIPTIPETPPIEDNKTYKINVTNGKASKDTANIDEHVVVTADTLENKEFLSWSLPEGVEIVSGNLNSGEITIKMPNKDITIEAIYNQYYNIELTDATSDKQKALAGEIVTLKATDVPGKRFSSWNLAEDIEIVLGSLTDKEISIKMPANDIAIGVNFNNMFSISVVNGTTNKDIAIAGEEIQVTANNIDMKQFVRWELPESIILKTGTVNSNTITFLMVNEGVNITAVYDTYYNVNATSTNSTKTIAKEGEVLSFTANNVNNKAFKSWNLGSDIEIVSGSLTTETIAIKMPARDITISPSYDDLYNLSLTNATTNKTVLKAGENITISAQTISGKEFSNWTLPTGVEIVTGSLMTPTITIKMPTKDISVIANYNNLYSISVTGGTASKTTAKQGEIITLTANTVSGKVFGGWTLSPNVTLTSGTLSSTTISFTMPSSNITATAKHDNIYTINVTGGTTNKSTAKAGETVTLTASTVSGKVFGGWTLSPNVTLTSGTLSSTTISFTMPSSNITATAKQDNVYTINVTGGTANKASAKAGETITLTASTLSGHKFTGWTLSPNVTLTSGTLSSTTISFIMPSSNIIATAAQNKIYNISIINSFDGNSSRTAYAGERVTLTASKGKGGAKVATFFQKWTCSPNTCIDETSTSITFTMPAYNVVITAHYEEWDLTDIN